jgi:tetratricopeptide (TPR) repeat protein
MLKAKKDKIRIALYTKRFKIQGDIYLYENSRLSDILNSDVNRDFLALTDVKIHNADNEKLIEELPFIVVNRKEVIIIYPDTQSREALGAYLKQAQDYIRQNMFDTAISEAKKVLTVSPDNAKAHYILGIAYGKKHLLNEALREFEDAARNAEPGSDVEHMAQEMINQIKI